jgi:hypothetical protein
MAETQEEAELDLKVMEIKPYEWRPMCEKCGLQVNRMDQLFRTSGVASADYTYCEGSLDSKVNVNLPFGGKAEMSTTCFGVFEEHLHLKCRRCGFHWLMATKNTRIAP